MTSQNFIDFNPGGLSKDPTFLKPVKKSRISGEVLAQLTNLILSGHYPVGGKLPPERELAVELSVTRTTLREALRQMESMGLVRVRQGDGIYVEDHRLNTTMEFINYLLCNGIGIDAKFIMDLEETRRIFITILVDLAVQRRDEDDITNLREIIEHFPRNDSNELLSGEWDFRFFSEIARAGKNMVFVNMLNTIKDLFAKLRWVYCQLDESPQSVVEVNALIVDAIAKGDRDMAQSILEKQLTSDKEKLSRLLAMGFYE